LQQTLAGFQVRCCASQRLHQARRSVYSFVQAAAAARVDKHTPPNILRSSSLGDGASVLCHLIVDACGVTKQDQ
jgi:hypothetical protein